MFKRTIAQELLELVADRPVVALVGPRQVGKTTLVLTLTSQLTTPSIYLDLESTQDLNRLQDPELYLSERQANLVQVVG